MSLINLKHIRKEFIVNDKEKCVALNDISLDLPSKGFVGILGKSGSGKSTLLSIIGLLDKPTKGTYIFNGRNPYSFKRKEINNFFNKSIGIVFQNYELFEDQSVLYNVMLPKLISGVSYNEGKKDAENLLVKFNINKLNLNRETKTLSGGEKQRVAIARALINGPKLLLCDEPTGALDSDNGEVVMETLKAISKNRLVIVVSHNKKMIEKYADQILKMSDGKILENIEINKQNLINGPQIKDVIEKRKQRWIWSIIKTNVRKRKKKNLFSLISLFICLLASFLIIGFSSGAPIAVEKEAMVHLDNKVCEISKQVNKVTGSGMVSLVQEIRPSKEDIVSLKELYPQFYFETNFSALVPSSIDVTINEQKYNDFLYKPVYDFLDIDESFLLYGKMPLMNSLYDVLINEEAYKKLNKDIDNVIGTYIHLNYDYQHTQYSISDNVDKITDVFHYSINAKIIGVVKELSFLSSPKIYYSYQALNNYLSEVVMLNLSSYNDDFVYWKDMVELSPDDSQISSCSCYMFLKPNIEVKEIENVIKSPNEPFVIKSEMQIVKDGLMSLIDVTNISSEIFLMIAIIGTLLILGMVSFSSYLFDIKKSALLRSIGSDSKSIFLIYFIESLIVCVLAFIISSLLMIPITLLTNTIITNFTNVQNMVIYPLFINVGSFQLMFLPIALFVLILLCFIAVYIPIKCNKKISIKEELQDND